MSKRILTVQFTLPYDNDEVDYTSLKSKRSLIDYDIAIISPEIEDFFNYDSEYQGKRSLSDTGSFVLKEHAEHWRREIHEAIRSGKTVFVILCKENEVYLATGNVTYSGTGRNTRSTRHVGLFTNYSIIPESMKTVNAEGTSMKLHGKDNILAAYWSEMKELSEYRTLIESEEIKILLKAGDKIAGAYIKNKNSRGALVLLPYIEFNRSDYITRKKDGDHWNEKGIIFGKKFISAICEIDKLLKTADQRSPIPDWVAHDKFELPGEKEIKNRMLEASAAIESLNHKKEAYEKELDELTGLKGLIYEQGKLLEGAAIDALKILGFKASSFRNNDSEFDVIFESKEGRLIGEVEGKDNKAINIDKLRQLQTNIQEDFERDEVKELAKGVLIGNAYRVSSPESRSDFFTEKCLTSAKSNKTALIRSTDLFEAARHVLFAKDTAFAEECRKAIVEAVGIVNFPKIPNQTDLRPLATVSEKLDA